MAELNEDALKRHIKESCFSSLYLIYGDEPYLKIFYTDKIVAAVIEESLRDFNFTRFDGKDTDLRDVFDIAMQFPMMGDKRCILVDDFKFNGLDDSEVKTVEKLFSLLPDTTVLIFRQDIVPINKKDSGKAVLELFKKYGIIARLDKRVGRALTDPLIASARRQGCVLSRDAAEYLVSQVGDEFNILSNELSKICNYVGSGEISFGAIDEVAVKTQNAKLYQLTDFLLRGNFDKAYEIFDILKRSKVEPEYMLGVIVSSYVDIYRAKAAVECGYTVSELKSRFDYKNRDFALNNASRRASKFSMKGLRKCFDILTEADLKLKRSRDNPMIIIEELMVKLSMQRG